MADIIDACRVTVPPAMQSLYGRRVITPKRTFQLCSRVGFGRESVSMLDGQKPRGLPQSSAPLKVLGGFGLGAAKSACSKTQIERNQRAEATPSNQQRYE